MNSALTSIGAIFAAVGVVVVILVAAMVGILLFVPSGHTPSTISSTLQSTASVSTSSSSTSSSATKSYALKVQSQGSASPSFESNLTTGIGMTRIPCDEQKCPMSYVDSGHNWTIDGDFEPGRGYYSANSSGLTLYDQTCFNIPDPGPSCGPFAEWNPAREENLSEISGVLYGINPNLTVFSIDVSLPYYGFFPTCSFNNSATGCSFEGGNPADSANFALDANGANTSSSIVVTVAEVPVGNTNGIQIGASTSTSVNGKYLGGKFLNGTLLPTFSPRHRLTIETDRATFLRIFIDNLTIYSSNSMPVDMSGPALAVNFYQFTSVNNETISTTWSNFEAWTSAHVTVGGLASGMSVRVNGTLSGFTFTGSANASGYAVVDVAPDPSGLYLGVFDNGMEIASFSPLDSGAVLMLQTQG